MQQKHRTSPRALVIPAHGPIETVELDGGLAQLQEIVGGFIEALAVPEFIDPDGRSTVYVNEEGKLDPACKPNMRATDLLVPGVGLFFGDHIVGPMIVAGFDPRTGEHADLPPAVEERVRLIAREAGDTAEPGVPAWVVEFIDASGWTLAKTRDHSYTVKYRTAADVETFERLVGFIHETGYERDFAGRSYIYLVVGEHRYWSQGLAPEATTVLNRAKEDRR